MRFAWCALALCFTVASGGDPKGNRHRRSPAAGVFLSIVGERPSENSNVKTSVLPVQLPIQLGGQGGVTLPVLVLPVPVYTQAPDTCSIDHNDGAHVEGAAVNPLSRRPPPPVNPPSYVPNRQLFSDTTQSFAQTPDTQPISNAVQFNHQLADQSNNQQRPVQDIFSSSDVLQSTETHVDNSGHVQNAASDPSPLPIATPSRSQFNFNPVKNLPSLPVPTKTHTYNKVHFGVAAGYTPEVSGTHQAHAGNSAFVNNRPSLPIPSKTNLNLGAGGSEVHFGVGSAYIHAPNSSPQADIEISSSVYQEPTPYPNQVFETSAQVVQSFLRQAPVASTSPAAVPRPLPDRLPAAAPGTSVDAPQIAAPAPPRPRFARSLSLRTDLTVPHSGYTEVFNTEWNAESQTARTVVEDGGTTFYRAPLSDGRVQFLEIRKERSGDNEVRRCTLSPLIPGSDADQTFPGLPDMEQFEFAGYTSAEGRSLVERWRRVVASGAGQGGAAQGESLTVHHEMLVTRDNGEAVPLKYTVVTDSSVMGPACDGYTARYRVQPGPAAAVRPDTARECDAVEGLPEPPAGDRDTLAEHVARFHPLREFALPTRDTRYDAIFKKYKIEFQRNYIDLTEEAVRKNLLTQKSRFIAAGNRLASTFELGANFLADRLDDELEQLLGVSQPADGTGEPGIVPFPYSNKDVEDISGTLPDEFDWRKLGGVSPVRFQGTTCSSCWAFAVAGATEGALFKKTNRLVPLSPQCLVDCGRPFGTNGCNGTWPSFAYDYVQARGLPSWDEYTDYQAKVLECKDRSVPPVTHISGHVNVTANSVDALKVAIKKHAPNVVIVDAKAKSFIFYKKGVLKDKLCGQNRPALNHAVIAVGWGKQDGEHFILKNSWTDKWGEEGFIRVAPESCALLQRPSYPLLNKPNIDRQELRAAADSVKEE